MGTYTTNYNLFLPTVGEQGWGTLVNGNFETIDTTMKSLSNRITAVENEVNGALSCTSLTTSGKITGNGGIGTTSLTTSSTITSTGLITGNGGFKGNLTGNITGNVTGNVTGKINVSSVGMNSINVTVAIVKPSDKSGTRTGSYGVQTISLSSSDLTVTRYNTSFLNCTKTDAELKSIVSNSTGTCTIVYTNSNTSVATSPTVKVVSGSTTVYNQTKTAPKGGSATHTFNRTMGTSYTVTIDVMNVYDKYSITTDGVRVYAT